jgi:ribosomal-protein-alanine N-acetyltransferase
MKIQLRKPLISDAARFLEILSHPEFTYFPAKPKTLEEEKTFLRKIKILLKQKTQYNFVIMANGTHVGASGIKMHPQLSHICEIGYFVDRRYWNKGIATRTVALMEDFIEKNLPQIRRIEIVAAKKNIGSCKVAVKSGYKKEGLMKKHLKVGEVFYDSCLYAKIVK